MSCQAVAKMGLLALRIQSRKGCGFKSLLSHSIDRQGLATNVRESFFIAPIARALGGAVGFALDLRRWLTGFLPLTFSDRSIAMAWIEKDRRTGNFKVGFWLADRKIKRSLKTNNRTEAETARGVVDQTLLPSSAAGRSFPPASTLATSYLVVADCKKRLSCRVAWT